MHLTMTWREEDRCKLPVAAGTAWPRGVRNPIPPKPAADRHPACGVTAVAGHLRGQGSTRSPRGTSGKPTRGPSPR